MRHPRNRRAGFSPSPNRSAHSFSHDTGRRAGFSPPPNRSAHSFSHDTGRRAGFNPPPNRSVHKPSHSSPNQDASSLRQNGYRPFIHRWAEARPTSRFVRLSLRRAEARPTSRFVDVSLRRAEARPTFRFVGVSLRRAEARPTSRFVRLSLRRAEARPTSRFVDVSLRRAEFRTTSRFADVSLRRAEARPTFCFVGFLCGGLKPAPRSASWGFLCGGMNTARRTALFFIARIFMPNYRRDYLQGGIYFFTIALQNRQARYLIDYIGDLRAAYRHTQERYPFETLAFTVLPDHLHWVMQLPAGDKDYSRRIASLKSGFSRRLPDFLRAPNDWSVHKREAGIWQRRFWEHRIRDERDLQNHVFYTYYNPVKHGLVAQVCDWPYSSFHRDVARGIFPRYWGGDIDAAILALCDYDD